MKVSGRTIAVLMSVILLMLNCQVIFAENVIKASVGDVEYYLVRTDAEGNETETAIGHLDYNGKIRAKCSIYNYGDSAAFGAILIMCMFDSTTNKLMEVDFDQIESIEAGTTQTLTADLVISDYNQQKIKCFVWESLSTLVPLGNTEPTAPWNVKVTSYTNSTADVSWENSIDDTNAVAYYNIYRDGKYVGSTQDAETNFKDVGIEHNTQVTYTVSAVDVVGAESEQSTPSEAITTKDIARLWFGAAAEELANENINADNFSLINQGARNISVTGVVEGIDIPVGDTTYSTRIFARDTDYEYSAGKYLGLDAIDFNTAQSRVLVNLDENSSFFEDLKDDSEIKVVMNYYDISGSYAEVIGKNVSNMIRYSTNVASTNIPGTTGITPGNTGRWKTAVFTLPTINNTEITSGTTNIYGDVFKDRAFDFKAKTSTVTAGLTSAYTYGYPAMFAIGSNNKLNSSYIQKIDIVGKDYVPYGAVIDWDKQSDTQFVELFRRDGYNMAPIESINGKKAMKLYSTADDKETPEKTRYMSIGVNKDYITPEDNKLILRVTYLDNYVDDRSNLVVMYTSETGTKNLYIPDRENTGEWKVAEFFIDDAAFDNSLNNNFSVRVMGRTTIDNPVYISRVEIIKR